MSKDLTAPGYDQQQFDGIVSHLADTLVPAALQVSARVAERDGVPPWLATQAAAHAMFIVGALFYGRGADYTREQTVRLATSIQSLVRGINAIHGENGGVFEFRFDDQLPETD